MNVLHYRPAIQMQHVLILLVRIDVSVHRGWREATVTRQLIYVRIFHVRTMVFVFIIMVAYQPVVVSQVSQESIVKYGIIVFERERERE